MLKRAARLIVPKRLRPLARRIASEAPHRLRDWLPDLTDRIMSLEPLPPPALRARVAWTSSRKQFLSVGEALWKDVVRALEEAGALGAGARDWLDFGCGAGRVARHFLKNPGPLLKLTGVDVDREAIAWCREHLLGQFEVVRPDPPTDRHDSSFDIVYSISVFTHLSEARQIAWLQELRRLLRPGGVLVASTHSPDLTWSRPDLTSDQHRTLSEAGFLFAPSGLTFNEDSAFNSPEHLRRVWGSVFELVGFRPHGLAGYQDLSVWRKT